MQTLQLSAQFIRSDLRTFNSTMPFGMQPRPVLVFLPLTNAFTGQSLQTEAPSAQVAQRNNVPLSTLSRGGALSGSKSQPLLKQGFCLSKQKPGGKTQTHHPMMKVQSATMTALLALIIPYRIPLPLLPTQ